MPIWYDSWFGTESNIGASQGNAILKVTDGDIEVSWLANPGFDLLHQTWEMPSAAFKNGGIYGNSAMADGRVLHYTVFDNVIENFRFVLDFSSINDMIFQINNLEELLVTRAPRYWEDRHYNNPVWIERKLDGESKTSYALISQGQTSKPNDIFSSNTPINQAIQPLLVQVNRQPFLLAAPPGQVQGTVTLSAQQTWDYARIWTEDDTLPTGQTFCFVEVSNGDIYAGGESEILKYTNATDTWSAETTTPVTLTADVTSAILLTNGDILFGEDGRIIKLTAAGVYSVETSEPTGQVAALLLATSGEVYAGDDGRIIKRDTAGAWAEDDNLPGGQVYSLLESSSGFIFAGEVEQILRTVEQSTPTSLSVEIIDGDDDAEEKTSGKVNLGANDLDFFQFGFEYIAMRFQNVTIPQGASIVSAIVRFTAHDNDTGTPGTANIYCEDANDSAALTRATNNISGRSLTTDFTLWENEPNWIKNLTFDSPDISGAVQEVVARGGWVSGNNLTVIVDLLTTGGDRDAFSSNASAGKAPELRVTYNTAIPSGSTWEVNSTLPGGSVRSLAETGSTLLAGEDGQILASDTDGENWEVVTTLPTNEARALTVCDTTTVYAGDNGNILKSIDGANNWAVDSTLPTAYVHAVHCAVNDAKWAGDDGRILTLSPTSFTLGQSGTTKNQIFVANHHKESNLTTIWSFNDDAVTYSSLFPAVAFPFILFPAVAAAADIVYFGVDTSLDDTGHFTSLIFDLSTGASATTSYTIVWEYWNGSWTSLTVQDNTSQLSLVGVHTVVWEAPSDWATTTINGTTGSYIRARLSALTGTFTNPVQQTRDIYSVGTPFVEISDGQAKGVVASLAKAQITNRSDNGGPGGSNPQLYYNRLLIGAKDVTDHENFRAFLNFADEQNPDGISVNISVDTDSATSFVNSLSSAVDRAVFFDASASTLDSLIDRVTIILATTEARDYYGIYKVFVRGKQTGGSAGEVSLRLKVVSGTGGISSLSEIQTTASTSDHELIEFDEPIRLPVSAMFTPDELGDETSITLQIAASQSDADFYAYDIFLLPVGTMYVDLLDTTNSANSAISNGSRLTIDSITIPKILARGLAEKTATGLFKSSYLVDSNGEFRLPNNRQHRLWIMGAQTESAGSTVWLSKPEVVCSVKVWKVDRFLTARGLI